MEKFFYFALNLVGKANLDWAVYAHHVIARVEEGFGLSWLESGLSSYHAKWLNDFMKHENVAELLRGVLVDNREWFGVVMAILSAVQKAPAGQSLAGFLKNRYKEAGVVIGGDQKLNPLLKRHMDIEGVYTKRARKAQEIEEWALGMISHKAEILWLSLPSVRDLPFGFMEEITGKYKEVILGPHPCPYLPELYRSWGVSYVVCSNIDDEEVVLSWVRRGGHCIDNKEYSLSVHAL